MQAQSKTRCLAPLALLFLMLIPYYDLFGKSIILFSPDDRPAKHLISHINNAKTRIYAAVYMFTAKPIAQALIEAKKRGVDVQIITDQASIDSPYGKIKMLQKNGISAIVFEISSNNPYYNPLMHHKFAVIDNRVWTGSFNWTVSANNKNQENVIYTDEAAVLDKYLAQFEKLKGRCVAKNEVSDGKPAAPVITRRRRVAPHTKPRQVHSVVQESLPSRPMRR